jgi:hypothetical protein
LPAAIKKLTASRRFNFQELCMPGIASGIFILKADGVALL